MVPNIVRATKKISRQSLMSVNQDTPGSEVNIARVCSTMRFTAPITGFRFHRHNTFRTSLRNYCRTFWIYRVQRGMVTNLHVVNPSRNRLFPRSKRGQVKAYREFHSSIQKSMCSVYNKTSKSYIYIYKLNMIHGCINLTHVPLKD